MAPGGASIILSMPMKNGKANCSSSVNLLSLLLLSKDGKYKQVRTYHKYTSLVDNCSSDKKDFNNL